MITTIPMTLFYLTIWRPCQTSPRNCPTQLLMIICSPSALHSRPECKILSTVAEDPEHSAQSEVGYHGKEEGKIVLCSRHIQLLFARSIVWVREASYVQLAFFEDQTAWRRSPILIYRFDLGNCFGSVVQWRLWRDAYHLSIVKNRNKSHRCDCCGLHFIDNVHRILRKRPKYVYNINASPEFTG